MRNFKGWLPSQLSKKRVITRLYLAIKHNSENFDVDACFKIHSSELSHGIRDEVIRDLQNNTGFVEEGVLFTSDEIECLKGKLNVREINLAVANASSSLRQRM